MCAVDTNLLVRSLVAEESWKRIANHQPTVDHLTILQVFRPDQT
jgi:hypothetical protein